MLNIFSAFENVKTICENKYGFIIEDNGKMGFRTMNPVYGTTILKCEFDRLSFESNGEILFAIDNGLGGYFDINGKCIFPLVIDVKSFSPIYSSISEDVIFVMQSRYKKYKDRKYMFDDKFYYGAINSKGELILDTIYDDYYSYKDGLATLLYGNMILDADLKGNIINKEYRYINEFNDFATDLWTHQEVRKTNY